MKKGRKVTSKNISQPPTRAVGRQKGKKKGGSGGTPVSTAVLICVLIGSVIVSVKIFFVSVSFLAPLIALTL